MQPTHIEVTDTTSRCEAAACHCPGLDSFRAVLDSVSASVDREREMLAQERQTLDQRRQEFEEEQARLAQVLSLHSSPLLQGRHMGMALGILAEDPRVR